MSAQSWAVTAKVNEKSRFGRIRYPYARFHRQPNAGKRKMPHSKKEIRSSKQPMLASQYRAIGPAAVAAAVLYVTRKKKIAQKFITPRAA
jgi:hypothetical protein